MEKDPPEFVVLFSEQGEPLSDAQRRALNELRRLDEWQAANAIAHVPLLGRATLFRYYRAAIERDQPPNMAAILIAIAICEKAFDCIPKSGA